MKVFNSLPLDFKYLIFFHLFFDFHTVFSSQNGKLKTNKQKKTNSLNLKCHDNDGGG